jgi:acetoin utilization protein AcuC
VNVPVEPYTGDASWLPAVELAVSTLAERFRPTFLVSQHGCDTHAWDPLAHLRMTTAAYARVSRRLDEVAHRYCAGRWFATGGGGYDAYRVVPRSWSLIWLAQAHRDVPSETPRAWRDRWETEATSFGQGGLPERYLDPPGTAAHEPEGTLARNRRTVERALERALELLPAT